MKFIDEQSECLCPIILTNNMLIELELKEQIFTCSVSLKDEQFVAINTNTLLNDLLNGYILENSLHILEFAVINIIVLLNIYQNLFKYSGE